MSTKPNSPNLEEVLTAEEIQELGELNEIKKADEIKPAVGVEHRNYSDLETFSFRGFNLAKDLKPGFDDDFVGDIEKETRRVLNAFRDEFRSETGGDTVFMDDYSLKKLSQGEDRLVGYLRFPRVEQSYPVVVRPSNEAYDIMEDLDYVPEEYVETAREASTGNRLLVPSFTLPGEGSVEEATVSIGRDSTEMSAAPDQMMLETEENPLEKPYLVSREETDNGEEIAVDLTLEQYKEVDYRVENDEIQIMADDNVLYTGSFEASEGEVAAELNNDVYLLEF